ncbi:MAG: hypothetical protein H7Z72_04705 [Bacteroidetes bacterium]|nr:hypothetical protein [Fibrella sp.]
MAQNTFKTHRDAGPSRPGPATKSRRSRRPGKMQNWLNEAIGLDRLFGPDNLWPIRHLNRILWVSVLLILYIGLNHNAERLVRRIQRTKADVDEARAEYTTLQADFMKSGKQSEIAKRVAGSGLSDSQTPPQKIVVKADEY